MVIIALDEHIHNINLLPQKSVSVTVSLLSTDIHHSLIALPTNYVIFKCRVATHPKQYYPAQRRRLACTFKQSHRMVLPYTYAVHILNEIYRFFFAEIAGVFLYNCFICAY